MQLGVVSLWSLLETCRAGSVEERGRAASDAEVALADERGHGLALALDGAALLVDDAPIRGGADSFAATRGLVAFLRDARVARVDFAAGVTSGELLRWAEAVVARDAVRGASHGVRVVAREDDAGAPAPLARASVIAAQPDSRLRSVFLQHRLIAGLPPIDGVDPTVAKLVVQQVVDRLMAISGGLEPLMLLQQDEGLLRRSTAVAVLTVLFARRCGWPAERLADFGVAGLLHDIGAILDPDEPDEAAFRWLLERGDEDVWLRSALVARRWRDGAQAARDAAGALAVVALVRLAVARGSGRPLDELVDEGSAPAELARAVAAGG